MRQPEALPHLAINQFLPGKKHQQPGAYGWGFDHGNFRYVIYGPPEADQDATNLFLADKDESRKHRVAKQLLSEEERIAQQNASHDVKGRQRKSHEKIPRERRKKERSPDHPPAHVHVIELTPDTITIPRDLRKNGTNKITTNREVRAELLHMGNSQYDVRFMLPYIAEDGTMSRTAKRNSLFLISPEHYQEIYPILTATAPLFAEKWQQLYSPEYYGEDVTKANKIFSNRYDLAITEQQEHEIAPPSTENGTSYPRLIPVLRRRISDTDIEVEPHASDTTHGAPQNRKRPLTWRISGLPSDEESLGR